MTGTGTTATAVTVAPIGGVAALVNPLQQHQQIVAQPQTQIQVQQLQQHQQQLQSIQHQQVQHQQVQQPINQATQQQQMMTMTMIQVVAKILTQLLYWDYTRYPSQVFRLGIRY